MQFNELSKVLFDIHIWYPLFIHDIHNQSLRSSLCIYIYILYTVSGQNARKRALTKCQKMKNRAKCQRTKCQITRTLALILNHTLMVVGSFPSLSVSLHTLSLSPYILSLHTHTHSISLHTLSISLHTHTHSLSLSISLSLYTHTHSLSLFPSLHTLSLYLSFPLQTLFLSLYTHSLSIARHIHSLFLSTHTLYLWCLINFGVLSTNMQELSVLFNYVISQCILANIIVTPILYWYPCAQSVPTEFNTQAIISVFLN